MTFDEVLKDTSFETSDYAGRIHLKRRASPKTPYFNLFGSLGNPNVVDHINLVSTSNPSTEFINKLVNSLNTKWGQYTSSDDARQWVWLKDGFTGTLTLEDESSSAYGSFLNLNIDSN